MKKKSSCSASLGKAVARHLVKGGAKAGENGESGGVEGHDAPDGGGNEPNTMKNGFIDPSDNMEPRTYQEKYVGQIPCGRF